MADWSSYTTQQGKNGVDPGKIAYEGIGGDQNSLTQFIRSAGNAEAKIGVDATATGKDTTGYGVDQLKNILSQYLGPLVSGSQTATENALQPQTDAISTQFDKVRQMLSDTSPRGGGKASSLAQQPYQKIGQVATLTNTARENAVDKAAGIGSTLAQTGLTEQQLGLTSLSSAGNLGLGKNNVDVQETAAMMQMIGQIASGIGTAASGHH